MPIITVHPSAVLESESSFNSVDASYPFSNAIGRGIDSGTYAQWYMINGGSALTDVFYSFDLSEIPENASITSVTCKAKCQAENGSIFRGGNTILALYSGTEKMTVTENAAFGTKAAVVTIPETAWTRDQLYGCKILVRAARGYLSTNTSYYIRFYGADLTVTYEIPVDRPKLWVKKGGTYTVCKNVYKKENGVWMLQSDLSAVFDENTKYVNK